MSRRNGDAVTRRPGFGSAAASLLAPVDVDRAQRLFLTRFLRPERILASAGLPDSDVDPARSLGLSPHDYRSAMGGHRRSCERAAQVLKGVPALCDGLHRLDGARVLALGDSITEDARSWAEILGAAMDGQEVGSAAVLNAGISGATAATLLRALPTLLNFDPHLVLIMVGTNDAQRLEPTGTLATHIQEFARLTHAIAESVIGRGAGLTWITPPPVLEDRIEASTALRRAGVRCLNDDLAVVRNVLLSRDESVVDLVREMGVPPAGDLISADGLHPSTAGQQVIARAVLRSLAGGRQ